MDTWLRSLRPETEDSTGSSYGVFGDLIEEFQKDGINNRSDRYGGSVGNMCSFLMQVVQAVVTAMGADRVGVCISPAIDHLDAMDCDDPLNLGLPVIERLNGFHRELCSRLTYLHVTRPRYTAYGQTEFSGQGSVDEEAQLIGAWRRAYQGTLICSGGFTRDLGMKAVGDGYEDLVSYGPSV